MGSPNRTVAAMLGAVALAAAPGPPADAATTLTFQPGQVVRTTLSEAQTVVPFLVRYPTYLPAGGRLGQVDVAFPPFRNAHRIQVNLTYGHGRWGVLVQDVWGHVRIGGGAVVHGRLDGMDAAIQQLHRRNAPTVDSIALYFPHMTCILTSLAIQQPVSVLRRMATSVRAR